LSTLSRLHFEFTHFKFRSITLDQFLEQYPTLQHLVEVMKTYITPQSLLLFIFGLLIVIRGIKAEEKTPPKTLQIGIPSNLQ
jgi:hypothetical protein